MKLIINNDVVREEEELKGMHTGAINYYDIEFEFSSEWDSLTKVAIIIKEKDIKGTEIAIIEDKITVPYLQDMSIYNIGIIGYTIDGEIKTKQISTNLLPFYVDLGAGSITTTEQEVPKPDVWEQYVNTMNNILNQTIEARDTTEGYKDDVLELKGEMEELYESYNENATAKTDTFNTNATNKTNDFNLNATEKTNIVNQVKDDVLGIQEEINETAGEVEENAIKAKASETNAKQSEDNAKISEDNADESESLTTQAYQDFLNQLGTEVATLTDGKLTPSQIPPLSINDVFEVENIEEMLELTAERGDIALIMGLDEDENPIVTDSYILATDDPTDINNWKKLGVSYVANAGHAQTAGTAENSNKINNHRLITMTESQYESAVLEEETLYAVYPE